MKSFRFLSIFILILIVSVLFGCSEGPPGGEEASTSGGGTEFAEITQAMMETDVEEPIGNEGEFEGVTIGFSQRRLAGSEWYEQLLRVAKQEADYLGAELIILDAQGQTPKQIGDLEDLVSRGVDAVILNPHDSSGVLPGVEKVHAAGIPLTIVNSVLDPKGEPFTFVSTYAFNTGYKSGRALAKAYDDEYGWQDEVKAAVLSANPQELESDQRRWGQISGYTDYMLDKYGKNNLNVVAYDYYGWVPDQALEVSQDMLQAHPDLDVVFAACDGGTQGVMPALEAAGMTGDVLVTSIDARKTVLKWIQDGDKGVVASVSNDPRLMGKWAVYFAANAAKGKMGPSTFYVPNPAITAENVDEYYDPDSLY
jgi:ribose transport system substrate-binding protein